MCTFNTLLLPASAPLEAINEIARETLHQTFVLQGNASIEAAVAAASSYVKHGNCDCGSELWKASRPQDSGPSERELNKLRADGWSQTKIDRWLAQRTANQVKREAEYERKHGGTPVHAAQWAGFVRRVLEERLAPWVGLFTHVYRGAIATERIEVGPVRRFAGVTVEQIAEIEVDVPFVFAAR